jgi:hypothetical protein
MKDMNPEDHSVVAGPSEIIKEYFLKEIGNHSYI